MKIALPRASSSPTDRGAPDGQPHGVVAGVDVDTGGAGRQGLVGLWPVGDPQFFKEHVHSLPEREGAAQRLKMRVDRPLPSTTPGTDRTVIRLDGRWLAAAMPVTR